MARGRRLVRPHRTTRRCPFNARRRRLAHYQAGPLAHPYHARPLRGAGRLRLPPPLWVIGWLAASVLLAFTLTATTPEAFIPTQATAQTIPATIPTGCALHAGDPVTGDTPAPCRGNYPALNPLTYALTTSIPAAALTTASWTPTDSSPLVVVFIGLKTVGWILTALLLAGVTGLLRRT